MTSLRQRLIEDMQIRNLAVNTYAAKALKNSFEMACFGGQLEGSPFNWREQRSGRLIMPVRFRGPDRNSRALASVCHWPQRESSISAFNYHAEQIRSHETRFTKSDPQGLRGILAEIVLLYPLSAETPRV